MKGAGPTLVKNEEGKYVFLRFLHSILPVAPNGIFYSNFWMVLCKAAHPRALVAG